MFRPAAAATVFAIFAATARAEEPEFEVVGKVERAATAPVNSDRALLSLSILPRPGYRLLADAPLVVRLDGSGVELPRKLYRRQDAVDPRADAPRFEIALKNAAPGARVDAELTFYICKAARCRPVTTRYGTSL